jgi:lysozyme family protein
MYESCSNAFDKAISKTLDLEGAYSNDRNDTGGETVYGVSRNNFPSWEGWKVVDHLKRLYGANTSEFKAALRNDADLSEHVRNWYKREFWNPFELDNITDFSLAFEIFDQSVNLGRKQTTLLIQRACNALNYRNTFGADLSIDGIVGPNTRRRLQEVGNDSRYTECLRRALDGLQVNHYISLGLNTNSRSDYRKYMRGWLLNRIGEVKE